MLILNMNLNYLPNVIIAGAPKCGTSSLYFWLSAHPEVKASMVKETFFFADEVNRFNKNANILSIHFRLTAHILTQRNLIKKF